MAKERIKSNLLRKMKEKEKLLKDYLLFFNQRFGIDLELFSLIPLFKYGYKKEN